MFVFEAKVAKSRGGISMSKKAVRGRAKLIKDTAQTKVWYKMYKNGKKWIVAGIATTALGLAVSTVPAKADTADTTDPGTTTPAPSTASGTGSEQTATLKAPVTEAATPLQSVANSTPQQATTNSTQTTTPPPVTSTDTASTSAASAPSVSNETSSTDTSKSSTTSVDTTGTASVSDSDTKSTSSQSQPESSASDQATTKSVASDNLNSDSSSLSTKSTTSSASAATPQQAVAPVTPAAPTPSTSTATAKALVAAPVAPLVMSSIVVPATKVSAVNPGTVNMTNTALVEAIDTYKSKTNASTTAAGLTQVGGPGTNAFFTNSAAAVEFSGTPFSGNIATYPNAISTEVINGQIWVKGVTITATNTRTVNGKLEPTPDSIITVTVPNQTLTMSGATSTFQQESGGVPSLFIESDVAGAMVTPLTTIAAGFPKSINISATTQQLTVGQAANIVVSTSQYYTAGTAVNSVAASNRVYDGVFSIENYRLAPTVAWDPFGSAGMTISGTGTAAGDTITIKTDDNTKSLTTKVGDNWTWSVDLQSAGFTATDAIYVVESNTIGDIPGAAVAPRFGQDTRTIIYADALTGATLATVTQQPPMTVQNGGSAAGISADGATITRSNTYTQTNGAAAIFPVIPKANLETIDGYLPATSDVVSIPGATNQDVKQYVMLYPAVYTVDPDTVEDPANPGTDVGPKDPNTPIKPGDPNSPVYPPGVAVNNLTTIAPEIIHYQDGETGETVAPDYTTSLDLKRGATVDLLQTDSQGNPLVTYTDWRPVMSDTFAEITNPVIRGYVTSKTTYPAVPVDLTQDNPAYEDTVNYFPAEVIVGPKEPVDPTDPTGPKNQGDTVTDIPDDPRVYPNGVTENDLNKSVDRTIHYVSALTGETLAPDDVASAEYSRVALVRFDQLDQNGNPTVYYQNWKGPTDYPDATSPTVEGYFTKTPVVEGTPVTVNSAPLDVMVSYYPTEIVVGPKEPDPDKPIDPSNPTGPKDEGDKIVPGDDNSPEYPAGVTAEDLNGQRLQTIHYVDKATGETVAKDNVATIAYTRTGLVDVQTGTVTYTNWTPAPGTFAAVTSPTVAGKITFEPEVAAMDVAYTDTDKEITVYYYPAEIVVGPKDPDPNKPIDETNPTGPKDEGTTIVPGDEDGPKYPAGLTADDLNAKVTQTIDYVNAVTGDPIAQTNNAELTFTRTGTLNVATNEVTYSDWQPVTTDEFAAVTSPTVTGYYPNVSEVPAVKVTEKTAPIVEIVKYYPAEIIVGPKDPDPAKPIDPSNPTGPKDEGTEVVPGDEDGPKYPGGLTADDLNTTKTQTIHYVDKLTGETVVQDHVATQAFERTGMVAVQTGTVTYTDWTPATANYPAVSNPTVDGKITLNPQVDEQAVTAADGNSDVTVYYYPAEVIVGPHEPDPNKPTDPTGPKDPGTSIVPGDEDGPKYPEGVTEKDLNTVVTQTVHYVNAGTGETVAPDNQATLAFTRTGTVNVATGTVTYSPWTPVTTDQFDAVTSPTVAGLYPIITTIDAVTVTGETAPIETTVKYYPTEITIGPHEPDPDKPTDPTGPKDPGTSIVPGDEDSPKYPGGLTQSDLNQIISRTINYLKPDGTKATDSVIQLVHYERQATLNVATGAVTYGDWTVVGANSYPAVVSPTIQGFTPDLAIVAELTVAPTDTNTTVDVHYAAVPGTSTPGTSTPGTSTPGTGGEVPTPGGGNGSTGNETPTVDVPASDTGGTTDSGGSAGTGVNGNNVKTGGSGRQVTSTSPTQGTVKAPTATGTITVGRSSTSTGKATLPQTDEANQATSLIGLLLMSALGLTGWKKRKKLGLTKTRRSNKR